jgi:CheY-like chemotaxis protein
MRLRAIEAGMLQFENNPFNLHITVEGVIDLFAQPARKKELELALLIEEQVPIYVTGDPFRLRQILTNLLSNAIKFTDKGEIVLRCRKVSDGRDGIGVRFEVLDTGIGIDPEDQRFLFTPFVQADGSTTRRFCGTGLGLAICKELVTGMGGEIGLESSLGAGSTFWFTAKFAPTEPLAPAVTTRGDLRNVRVLSSEPKPEPSPLATNRLRVLLTEDNPLNQRVALYQLRILDHHVDVASNGVEALKLLDENQYDAILMDIHMPEMDGYATTTEIRQREGREKHTPIIAMTANASPADREKCLAVGMDDHLAKPVQMRDLVLALERCGTRTEPAKTEPLFRAIDLRPLIDSGMADIIPRLIEIFLQTAPRDIEQAAAAVHNSDATDLEHAAHRLKGGCSNLGAARLRNLCQQLEEHGRDGSLQNAPELMAAVKEEFGRVRMELIAVRDHQGFGVM